VSGLQEIPARRGKAARLTRGQTLRVVNTHGTQVVDTWAFNADDLAEFMSMEHCHTAWRRTMPKPGEAFVTNKRRPILTVVEDTSPGIHDTLISACDRYRYEMLGHKGYHESCTENLHLAMAELGVKPPEVPCPLNMWMNIPVGAGGALTFEPTVSKPGDHVLLKAELNAIVVFSACPMDLTPINGLKTLNAHFQIE
jgi:uncharacterized protein YcgI (DUF1989 family)